MTVEHLEKFTLLKDFEELEHSLLKKTLQTLEKKNVVLVFPKKSSIRNKDFLVFLDIAQEKNGNGTSFVIISNEVSIDDVPEGLNIVPTLQEAEDIIDMENMERELGF